MRLILAPALLLSLAAVPVLAQQAPTSLPGRPDTAAVTAGTYAVDSGHTQLLFTVNHMGFSEYTGQFVQPTGNLVIDPKNPSAAKVDITFDVDKVSTTVPALDAHLKRADFFDAAKFPQARFVSTRIVAKGMQATITGNLTLHGVTRPVTLQARFIGAGASPMGAKKTNIGFHATGQIKRSDFGVSYAIPVVSDRVDLVINAAFEAA